MDTLIRFMAVLLAIILVLLFPLQYIAQSQDETVGDAVHSQVREFTDTVRNQGYLSMELYEDLEELLGYTGEQYELSLTVSHPVTAVQPDTALQLNTMPQPDTALQPDAALRPVVLRRTVAPRLNAATWPVTTWANMIYPGTGTSTVRMSVAGTDNFSDPAAAPSPDALDDSDPVLPKLSGISVTPSSQSVKRYAIPSFTVTAHYEDDTSKIVASGYEVDGLDNRILGLQTATISYSEDGITRNEAAAVTFTPLTTTCQVCGTDYELDENDTDKGCPVCHSMVAGITAAPYRITVSRGEELPVTVTAVYQNGVTGEVTGWTSNYDPNMIGIRQVEIEYQGIKCAIIVETLPGRAECPVCNNLYDLNPNGTDPGCPVCSREVTGITVAEDRVAIEKFDILPITVTAAYKDHHTDLVYDWSADFIPDSKGIYSVTIYYKTFTDTVVVEVLDDDEITCPICGIAYNRPEHPGGCPVCSVTLTGIEARLRNGVTQIVYKSEIRPELTLTYRDGHQELVYSGYTLTHYNPDKLGFQDIAVHYQELEAVLRIEVVKGPPRMACPKGHEYYLNEDGTDPGCPFCEGQDKNSVITYFEAAYTPEILQALIEEGEYRMKKGDYITVTILQKDVSVRSRLRRMFFGTNSGISNRRYTYGGEVY